MCRQIAREITGRRVTLAGIAAIASLAFATWAFIPNAYSTSDVENCDRTLGPAAPGLDFSGVFEGSIVEVGQGGSAAQAKFVRNGHSVQGSYLLGEICGSINGEVTRDRLEFSWRRAGNSGHGIASQIADRVSGTFGLGEDAKGEGIFVLIQRAGSPPAASGQSSSIWDTADLAALNQQVTHLYNQGHYAEAIPLAERALAIREKARGPDHHDVAASLNNLAVLYRGQGRYAEAEPLFKRSLAIKEKAFGPDHPDVALSLNNLGLLYQNQGRYADAEPLYKRALAIKEKILGTNHPDVAAILNDLGVLYDKQGRYVDAEPPYKRALAIRETALGPDHRAVAISLNNLAFLYREQGRYAEAEPLYQRSLAIKERALGPEHPDVAAALNNLAVLYSNQGRFADAELLHKRALAIKEKAFGPDHPDVALSLSNLAELYRVQGRYADAAPLYQRALAIRENKLGPDHPDVAASLNNLAGLYETQGRYTEAEPLSKRSLAILEKAYGPDHLDVARSLNNLAGLYETQGRYTEAEPLFQRSLAIREKAFGPDHPDVAAVLNNLAVLYSNQGRFADAELLHKRALAITEKAFGPDHPDVAISLSTLAQLYQAQGRYLDAEPRYKRALAIKEKILGTNHPDVATILNHLAFLYQAQGRYVDAEPLYKRSLEIGEKALGPDHPDVAASLNNLAGLYETQGRYTEAEPLSKRSLAIKEKALGPDHPDVARSLNNLAETYRARGQYADAEPLYKRSLEIVEKAYGLDHPDVAASLNNLASLYLTQGRYPDAEPRYLRSLEIWEKSLGSDHPNVSFSSNNLALLYQAQGRYADAELLFKRSLAIREKALGPDHPDVAFSLNNLAGLYLTQSRYSDALPIVQRTIAQNSANKSIAFGVLHGSQNQNLISPTQALDASYTVLQRSVSSAAGEAVSKLAARFAVGNNEIGQLVRKDQDLTAEAGRLDKSIIAAVSKPPNQRNASTEDQMRKRIEEVKSERDKLQDVFNQRFPDYVALSKPQPLTIEQTQALLADDEALVTIDLDKKSYVWVITKDQAEWKELAINAEDVSKLVETLRTGLDPDSVKPKPFDRNVAHRVYRQVLGPIEELISQKTRLSFVLSGALTSLPLQVLITSDPEGKDLEATDWLVRKYAITILPSVASLKILRNRKLMVAFAKPMIGFGNPILDRTAQTGPRPEISSLNRSLTSFYRGMTADTAALANLIPLPETANELRTIANELGAEPEDIKLGEAATVTDVKHERLDNYRVVYFATHALVAGQVEELAKVKAEPALVLSIPDKPSEDDDGLLRASDVAMLKMNADFVVLSACNTAAGDKPGAEALSGLARAFFYAGAKSLIVSHWEVDSDSTVALMTGLFDALKNNPHLTHAEALRISMLQMINNPSNPYWGQPKLWAPFFVVGEPQKE